MKHSGLCMGCMDAKGEELIFPQCGYREEEEAASPYYLSPGTTLDGKYLLGRVLGQGGFGITYIAWDTNLKIKPAIKEYFPQELALLSIAEKHTSAYIGSKSDQYQYGLGKFPQESQTLAKEALVSLVEDELKPPSVLKAGLSPEEEQALLKAMTSHGRAGRGPFSQCSRIIGGPGRPKFVSLHHSGESPRLSCKCRDKRATGTKKPCCYSRTEPAGKRYSDTKSRLT